MAVRGLPSHIDLTVTDVARSARFYDALLGPLGLRRRGEGPDPCWRIEGPGAPFELALRAASPDGAARAHDRFAPGLHHVAFHAAGRGDVDAVHERMEAQGAALGARILDPPAEYTGPAYSPGYYAVFFADPDGLKLEVVHEPQARAGAAGPGAAAAATASWAALARQAPQIAAAGRRLLEEEGGAAVAYLTTVSAQGMPHVAPVCPIFCGEGLYLCAAEATPKRRDLEETGRFVLHAPLGPGDEELQVAGRAVRVEDAGERAKVHAAIRFTFQREDPLFRLELERALRAHWEDPGQPGTRAVRTRWRAGPDRAAP